MDDERAARERKSELWPGKSYFSQLPQTLAAKIPDDVLVGGLGRVETQLLVDLPPRKLQGLGEREDAVVQPGVEIQTE